MVDLLKGKYRIVREIARSNDIVYEAIDTSLGRRVAIKELNFGAGMGGQARRERIERFNREARAAGRLSHPNIVAIYDVGEENGRHYIAMEYLEGQNLREIEQVRSPLPLNEAIDIACQTLDALAYAHANHVIHRDIKPDNIQVLPGCKVKLTDFGIARLTEEPALTGDGQVFGTPSFMSPEQIEGRSIDSRTDLFSLAVVLYEMLMGRKPFTGDSVVSITYAIMHAEPPPMYGVPAPVEEVIRRALAKQPENRQATAEVLIRELKRAVLTPTVAQVPPSYAPPPGVGMPTAYPPPGTPIAPMPPLYGAPAPTMMAPGPPATAAPGMFPAAGQGPATIMGPGPAQAPATPHGALPWAFNHGQQHAAPNAGGVPYQAAPGAPFAARRSEPFITVSPKAQGALLSILAAAIIGSIVAFAVWGVYGSGDAYERASAQQKAAVLLAQGVTAYSAGEYADAVRAWEEARTVRGTAEQRLAIEHNLVAGYIQAARVARSDGRLSKAQELYGKALKIAPDDPVLQSDVAALRGGAAAQSATPDEESTTLHVDTTSPAMATTGVGTGSQSSQRPDDVLSDRRQQARDLIEQGVELQQNGDLDAAREKWTQAIEIAPGTPERDTANDYLNGAKE